jgi:hypothetical protein
MLLKDKARIFPQLLLKGKAEKRALNLARQRSRSTFRSFLLIEKNKVRRSSTIKT